MEQKTIQRVTEYSDGDERQEYMLTILNNRSRKYRQRDGRKANWNINEHIKIIKWFRSLRLLLLTYKNYHDKFASNLEEIKQLAHVKH